MKVSLVIPVYNVEKYICSCLDSILLQECKDYEIVLVNDGSNDSSAQICDRYAQLNDNVRVVHKDNEGTYQARLDGARVAVGDYVWFIDPDDWILSDTMKKLLELLNKFKDIDVLIFNYCINGSQNCIKKYPLNEKNYKTFVQKNLCKNYEYNSLWSECIKRDLIINNNQLYDIKRFCYAEDAYMNNCIIDLANTVMIVDDVFYSYRVEQHGITSRYNAICVDNNKITFERLFYLAKKLDEVEQTNIEKKVVEKQSKVTYFLVYMLMKTKLPWNEKINEYNRLLKDSFIKTGIENKEYKFVKWWEKYISMMIKLPPILQTIFLKIGEILTQLITLIKLK